MSAMEPLSRRARRVSVGTKLALATAALMAVVSTGVYFALSRSLTQTLLSAKGEAVQEVGTLFASNVSAAVVFEDPDVIRDGLKHLGKNPDVTFAALWSRDAEKIGSELGRYAREGHEQRSSVVLGDAPRLAWDPDRLSLSVPVRDEYGKIIADGLIEFSLASENAKIAAMRQRTLLTSCGVAGAVLLLLLVVSRRTVLVPLQRLQAGAQQLERGESAIFDIQSDDEVGALGSALKKMAGAIREREDEIQRRNRDMRVVMDNVGQGFLTLNTEGVMSDEYSHILEDWFGRPEHGEKFMTYLERLEPKFAAWFAVAFAQYVEDYLPAELSLAQAPKRLMHGGKAWNFEYRPILSENERIEGLIVVISDVTSLLEKAAAERAQQEIIAALTRSRRDPQGYREFLQEAEALVSVIEAPTAGSAVSVFRQIHTLKGICAIMEVQSVVQYCHELEERQVESAAEIAGHEKAELRQLWADYIERIGPLIASIDENGIFIEHGRYQAFLRALEAGRARHDLLEEARAWSFEDSANALERLAQHARQLAARLGKGEVAVEIESSDVRIPRGACSNLWSALVHAIRNAVDHGLEPAHEREASGKPARGTLRLSASLKGNNLVLTVSDDGRGIDWPSIARRAAELGLPNRTKSDLERALFSDRLTTKADATSTSGRGIGTAALKETVAKLGGRIEVESSAGQGTTFRFLLPKTRIFETQKSVALPNTGETDTRVGARRVPTASSLSPFEIPPRNA